MKRNSESVWTYSKMISEARKHGVSEVYICRKNGADALSCVAGNRVEVVKGSVFAPVNDKFNAVKNFVQDYRRISIKAGHEVEGVSNIRINFTTLAKAAQFVSASQSARARDWKKIPV